jgi:hypothetical protein
MFRLRRKNPWQSLEDKRWVELVLFDTERIFCKPIPQTQVKEDDTFEFVSGYTVRERTDKWRMLQHIRNELQIEK